MARGNMSRVVSDMDTSGRTVVRNAAVNVTVLGLQSAIGLALTPFLVRHLGIAEYGLVPLAMSIGSYVSIAAAGVQVASGRYLAIAISARDHRRAQSVFSTSVWGVFVLSVLLLLFAVWPLSRASLIFEVPSSAQEVAGWFFFIVFLAYVLLMVREVIGAVAFAHNRLDLQGLGRAVDFLLRLAVPVAAFTLLRPLLTWVGAGMVAGTACSLLLMVVVWRRLAPDISIAPRYFDKGILLKMLRTGAWISLSQAGAVLHLSVDVVVANLTLGSVVAGYLGTVAQWPVFLRALSGAVVAVLTPILFRHYAVGNTDQMKRISESCVGIVSVACGLAVALTAGFGGPLLSLWLGPGNEVLWPLLAVSVIHLVVNLAVVPLFAVHTAFNKVRTPALVTLLTGVLNVGLSVWWADLGPYGIGIALATVVALTLKNALFTPWYTARVLNVSAASFMKPLVPGLIMSLLTSGVCFALAVTVEVGSWAVLLALAVLVSVVYLGLAWKFALSRSEKDLLMTAMRRDRLA